MQKNWCIRCGEIVKQKPVITEDGIFCSRSCARKLRRVMEYLEKRNAEAENVVGRP